MFFKWKKMCFKIYWFCKTLAEAPKLRAAVCSIRGEWLRVSVTGSSGWTLCSLSHSPFPRPPWSVDRRGRRYNLQGIRVVRDPWAQMGHLRWPHRYAVDREHEHGSGWQQKGISQWNKCLNEVMWHFANILLHVKPQIQTAVPDFWKEQVQDGVSDKL